jgi:hypothetical protein
MVLIRCILSLLITSFRLSPQSQPEPDSGSIHLPLCPSLCLSFSISKGMRLADVSSRQPAAITRHQRLIVDVVVVVHEVSLPCVRLRYRVKGFV